MKILIAALLGSVAWAQLPKPGGSTGGGATGGTVGGASSLTTPGYLPMASATPGVLTPSPVYSDGTNVGVGTAGVSSANLTVSPVSGAAGIIVRPQAAGNAFAEVVDSAGLGVSLNAVLACCAYVTTTGARDLGLGTNNGTTVTIANTGTVGINTTDLDGTPPIGKLTVKGATNDGSTYVLMARNSDEANVASLDTLGRLVVRGGTVYDERSTVGSSLFTIKAGEGQSTNSLLDIWLNTAGTTPGLHVKGDGGISIGHTNSGNLLDLRASKALAGLVRVQNTSTGGYSSFDFYDNAGGLAAGFGYGNSAVGGLWTNSAVLHTISKPFVLSTDGATTAALYISDAGNSAFGTTDLDGTPPIGRLTVQAACADDTCNALVLRDSGNVNVLTVDGNGLIQPLGGYKSADGTAGATVTTCTSFKNGLCVAGS